MLAPGDRVRVHLVKPKPPDVVYPVEVIADDGIHLVVEGPWSEPEPRDVGFATFEPGDRFTEHYWRDRWYAVKEVRATDGTLKGWYCDIARPTRVSQGVVVSEDLDLDLWVWPDRRAVLRLDEDEFEASGLMSADPPAAEHARRAIVELERLVDDGWDELLATPGPR